MQTRTTKQGTEPHGNGPVAPGEPGGPGADRETSPPPHRDRTPRAHRLLSRRGLSLVEVMLSLFIVAVIIVFVVGLGLQARSAWLEHKTTTFVAQITNGVNKVYAGARNYGTGNLLAVLADHGALPPDAIISGSDATLTLRHPHGGAVTVTGATNTYTITLAALGDDICASLVTKFRRSEGFGTGLSSVTVNATELAFPVTPASAGTTCDGGDSGNEIVWTYF